MTYKVTARITSLNHRGEGAGRVLSGPYEGLVVFVPGTVPGDVVESWLIERKKTFLRGKPARFLEKGPGRVEEACRVASRCGGCSWQHIDYKLQLEWKRQILTEALFRIAKVRDCPVRPCIPSPKILGYRNKVEVPLAVKDGSIVAGFYEPYSHNLVPSETCLLEHPLSRQVILHLLEAVRKRKYSVYDEKTGRGQVRHLVSRVAPGTGERMAVIVSAVGRLPGQKDLADEMLRSVSGLKSVVLNVNAERTNVILGERDKVLGGRGYIVDILGDDEIGRLKFCISPHSFYQVNSEQAVNLYRLALSAAEITSDDLVYDVYSGIGTITLFAARKAKRVIGVEEVRDAVSDARKNAKANDIPNVGFREGKAERVLPSLVADVGRPDVVILDPPRGGAERAALVSLAKVKPRRIAYVSCNPATLARDLVVLREHGWYPEWCQPLDMFPMTPHVETIVPLKRKLTRTIHGTASTEILQGY